MQTNSIGLAALLVISALMGFAYAPVVHFISVTIGELARAVGGGL